MHYPEAGSSFACQTQLNMFWSILACASEEILSPQSSALLIFGYYSHLQERDSGGKFEK